MAKETESPSAGASGDGRARALLPAERSRDSERRDAICRRNVRMMLVFQATNAFAWGVAMGPVFDKYLYYLGGGAAVGPTLAPHRARNSLVGMTESISGLAGLVLAIPVGILVDALHTRRAFLLKLSTIFAVATAVLGIAACVTDIVLLLYAALVMLGIFAELASSTSEALFADSIPAGHRSGLFTTKAIVSTVGNACGPLLSAFGLLYVGDVWKPYQMKAVVIAGCILTPLSCLPCLFFQDPPAVAAEPEATPSTVADATDSPTQEAAAAASESGMQSRRWGPFRGAHVPFILAFADLLTCIGAGMTVKFFNLFFIQDMHFSPTDICWLNTAYPLVIAAFMKVTQRLSKPLGRAQASLLFFSCNVVALLLLSRLQSLPILLIIFLLRGGFANSTSPLDRSILMDFTPSTQRGRWNAVESFTSITWSGSAFFGGILSDSHDYRFTFLITAAVYALGCVAYVPLLGLVPRREASAATCDAREVAVAATDAAADCGTAAAA